METVCKYCNRKPVFSDRGRFCDFSNSESLARGGWATLEIGVDKDGKLIMYACGDGHTDYYYPKYCPECGRKMITKECYNEP